MGTLCTVETRQKWKLNDELICNWLQAAHQVVLACISTLRVFQCTLLPSFYSAACSRMSRI